MPPRNPLSPALVIRRHATTQLPLPKASSSVSNAHSNPPSILTAKAPAPPRLIAPSPSRIYTERKAYLYAYYAHLLRRSHLVLLFEHDNLSQADMNRVRIAIQKVVVPPPPTTPSSSSPPPPPTTQSKGKKTKASRGVEPSELHLENEPARITIVRTGVFSALAKSMDTATSLAPFLTGQTAMLTCPSLSPSYLSKLLRAINRAITASKRPDKRDKVVKQPLLRLVAGLLEGNRLLGAKEVEGVSKLPEMDVLRAQLVGMLEGQGRSLVGVLGQAGGGGLVRTLQGLEKDLEGKAGGPQETVS